MVFVVFEFLGARSAMEIGAGQHMGPGTMNNHNITQTLPENPHKLLTNHKQIQRNTLNSLPYVLYLLTNFRGPGASRATTFRRN